MAGLNETHITLLRVLFVLGITIGSQNIDMNQDWLANIGSQNIDMNQDWLANIDTDSDKCLAEVLLDKIRAIEPNFENISRERD